MCKILKFAYYRHYCTDYNQILHSHKVYQILFVGGPNTRKTNPRWRTAAILKNRKSPISLKWFDRSLRNLARWRTLGLRTGSEVEISHFWKSKMAVGRHLEKSKNRHISAAVWAISTKFGKQTTFDPLERPNRKKFEIIKIQDGGGRHLEKSKIGHISGTFRPTFAIFGTMMHIGPLNWVGS